MEPDQKRFFRELLHNVLNMAMGATIWRLPTVILVIVIGAAVFLIWKYGLF